MHSGGKGGERGERRERGEKQGANGTRSGRCCLTTIILIEEGSKDQKRIERREERCVSGHE